jgi:hypothetical protein
MALDTTVAMRLTKLPSDAIHPFVDFAFRILFRVAVFFLYQTDKLFATTLGLMPFIVGDVAPLGLCLALELLPVALDLIPVHHALLLLAMIVDEYRTRGSGIGSSG